MVSPPKGLCKGFVFLQVSAMNLALSQTAIRLARTVAIGTGSSPPELRRRILWQRFWTVRASKAWKRVARVHRLLKHLRTDLEERLAQPSHMPGQETGLGFDQAVEEGLRRRTQGAQFRSLRCSGVIVAAARMPSRCSGSMMR